ncbi:MAG: LamG-like jellyroll fold domain-containing protein [Limisphaerales bacterium]
MIRNHWSYLCCLAGIFAAAHLLAVNAASPVVLSEFMAANSGSLVDEDGDSSDWIELHNDSTESVNLDGWYLTDRADRPTKWRCPATNLVANGYLVIFASGKDRRVAGAPLHTSFQLSAGGEYLALVTPDGRTVATEFVPAFPGQREDVSFGTGQLTTTTNLVVSGAEVRYLIPVDDGLGLAWTSANFADSAWSRGKTGLGFASNATTAAGGLFGYWPIAEGAGNVASNLVEGAAHGIIHGATWVTDDPTRGTVLSFNGQGSYVAGGSIPPMGQSTTDFTWSFWYRQNSVPNVNSVVLGNRSGGAPGGLQFIKFTPSNFEYYHDGDIGFMPFAIPSGTWQHLVVAKSGPNLRYHANGVLVGTATAAGDIGPNPFYWGGDPGAGGEFADGLLDDVSLWTTALNDDQVAALHAGASPLSLDGVGSWVSTDVSLPMLNRHASAYVRIAFIAADGAADQALKLRIKYDDGFIAYLNGVEIARRNAPADVRWDSTATAERAANAAVRFEEIDVSAHRNALQSGPNVLALHGLNVDAGDPDFLLLPELEATSATRLGERYFAQPTPGAPNEAGVLGFVADTAFSHERGFHETNLAVTLSCATPEAVIRYTLDGTLPSATHGFEYVDPVPVSRTTVLRAGGFKPGHVTPKTSTCTYLFLEDVLTQTGAGLPADWGNDWEMDARVVNDPVYAPTIRNDMKSLPIVCVSLDPQDFWGPDGIYTQSTGRGPNYERPGSVELFFPDGSRPGIQADCGVRIVGSASRVMSPKRGLGLLFQSRYGPSKFNYRFFEDSPVDKFDFLAFRPNFNMSWVRTDNSGPLNNSNADGVERTHAIYVRDQFTKDSQLAMGQLGAHERFVHLYINGVYWGLYNPSEHTDASFAASYLSGNKDQYDAIFSHPSTVAQAVDGDKEAWEAAMQVARQGLASATAYAQLRQFVDVTNLADYMMLNFYCSTVDWPWQNWNAVRKRETNALFKFLVWDAEYTLETPPWVPDDRTGVGHDGGERDSPAYFYAQLRQNAEWRLLFADQVRRHCFHDGALTPSQAIQRFLGRCEEIDRAIVCESARWGDVVRTSRPYTRDVEWLTEKNRLLADFFPARTARLVQILRNAGLYPRVDSPEFNEHGGRFTNQFILTVTAPQGTVYLTTDGTDPRLPGGGIAPTASAYLAPVVLTTGGVVRARALDGGVWSALNEASFSRSTPAALTIELSGALLRVSWPLELEGFQLETAESLDSVSWAAVPGVVDHVATIAPDATSRFYRLRHP